jgi:hypothetical protein
LIKFQISNLRFEIMRKNFFGSGDLAFSVPAFYRSHRRADPESALRNLLGSQILQSEIPESNSNKASLCRV